MESVVKLADKKKQTGEEKLKLNAESSRQIVNMSPSKNGNWVQLKTQLHEKNAIMVMVTPT